MVSKLSGLRQRPDRLISRIDVSAFAAILVVLFALFAVRTAPHDLSYIPVDLVKAKSTVSLPHALREDAIVVSVMRNGDIFLGTDISRPELLPDKIREAISRGAERRIYVNADRRANYRDVKKAIDSIYSTGVENISILAFPVTPSK
jgi:biopolymer transport protein TolR